MSKSNPSKGGKPRLDPAEPTEAATSVRATPTEKARWQKAAAAAGMKLSPWLRKAANAAAQKPG